MRKRVVVLREDGAPAATVALSATRFGRTSRLMALMSPDVVGQNGFRTSPGIGRFGNKA